MDISSMLEVQVNEVKEADSKENVTPKDYEPSTAYVAPPISQEEYNFYKLMFGNDLPSVRFRRLHCTACDVHIGSAPAEAHNMFEHPVLRTLLCAKCREFYGDGTFEQGDDATDMFCRWCANGGNLYCCSYCSNTFCYKCIKRNFDSLVRKKIEADEKWKCFVCNPSDLYTARAVCWALLQHVQTVKRILQNDRNMSPQEIEEKMNYDESQCCPRRRKRKRRRTRSTSEEEDETYIPTTNNVIPILPKRKQEKSSPPIIRLRNFVNGVAGFNNSMVMKPRSILPAPTVAKQIPLTRCSSEQSLIDGKNIANNQDGKVRSSANLNCDISLPSGCVISAVPTSSLLVKNAPGAITKVAEENISEKTLQRPAYNAVSMPMVSIPNQNAKLVTQPRVFVRAARRIAPKPIIPSVIEIDSDSDEPTIVELVANSKEIVEEENRDIPVVPVALLSSEDTTNNNKTEEPSQKLIAPTKRKSKSFSEIIGLHNRSIDTIMNNLKSKVQRLSDTRRTDVTEENELNDALSKTKRFHEIIRNAVEKLATINDTIVRDYITLRSNKPMDSDDTFADKQSKISVRKDIKLPLDMVCVNESDSESDDDDNRDGSVVSPSELVLSTNVLEGMTFYKKKCTTNRAVGTTCLQTEDKAVQVYDVIPRDFEKCIGYSLLTRADYEKPDSDEPVLRATVVTNEHFGKYEEQFINYLQHIEDHGIETESDDEITSECAQPVDAEDTSSLQARVNGVNSCAEDRLEVNVEESETESSAKNTTDSQEAIKSRDPNETCLKDLIEANSPFVSEMLESMVESKAIQNSSTTQLHKDCPETNSSTNSDNENVVTTSSAEAVDDLVKIVSKITDDLATSREETRSSNSTEEKSVTKKTVTSKKTHSSETNCYSASNAESEEDCMIIVD